MKTRLTQQQIDSYRTNGFLLIEDFFTPQELEQWGQTVAEAASSRGNMKLPGRMEAKPDSDDYIEHVFVQRMNLWQSSQPVRDLIFNEELGRMMCELAGIDGIRLWHDSSMVKQPWGNATTWHLDNPYWSFSSKDSISIWIPFQDATMQNGCLYFLPGTHKTARFDPTKIGPNMESLFQIYPEWSKIEPVAVPVKAGSVSIHNGLVAHAAGPNMTPRSRRAFALHFMPEGSKFNGERNVLTPERFAKLKVGDSLDDDAENPLVYSRKNQTAAASAR